MPSSGLFKVEMYDGHIDLVQIGDFLRFEKNQEMMNIGGIRLD